MTGSATLREKFLEEYRIVRYAEGRGSERSDYYRALPFTDLSGRNTSMWDMRARTYSYFEKQVLAPLEKRERRPLSVLDLGAGNCWLSYRLTLRKHLPVALDFFADERDGLRAAKHYPTSFPVIEADFDHLPIRSALFDVVIFNASLHYSSNYLHTLAAAKAMLRARGQIVVLDSPFYKKPEHGMRMVEEKRARFLNEYGFRSDTLPSQEFLDVSMLNTLANEVGIKWHVHKPWYGMQWHLRPLHAWLRRRRPPSRFWILVGTRNDYPATSSVD